ncbi:MAG: hypothetical protein FJW44_04585 [Actinobacteria bacterium]|nr:hypothetical protein [Actinomycetota bacterium]
MSTNGTRKSQLLSLKLLALVREHLGPHHDGGISPAVFARGAAALESGASWVLVAEQTERGLGPALLWALKAGSSELNVLAESDTGTLARQAAYFEFPITVWHVDDGTLMPATAEPLPDHRRPSPEHAAFMALIAQGGATPVVEHGIVAGEVLGLEVCRAVDDPVTGAARLEVGMGAHDREAFAMLHGDKPTVQALAEVVDNVKQHRRPGALPHPFNRIAPERMLRANILDAPAVVGASSLVICDPPVPRTNVLNVVPCVARGRSHGGADIVVVVTSGADPDIVPYALDARARVDQHHGSVSELRIAMPAAHITPTNRRALGLAHGAASFVELDMSAVSPS